MFSERQSQRVGRGIATQSQSGLQSPSSPQTMPVHDSSTQGDTKQSPSSGLSPSSTLPKGGGAIRSMGEKFNVNPSTGTATLSIPIATSPSRGETEPNLSLTYDSGDGNGAFGLGWSLSVSSITRKTNKGIPRYGDLRESDVFLLTGADDLVPIFKRREDGSIVTDEMTGDPVFQEEFRDGYVIRKYSPRVDQLFLRIERWTKLTDTNEVNTHWRTITPDNVTSIYGRDDNSRIYNSRMGLGERCIFSWLLAETYDTKGNAIIYKYKAEDSVGVGVEQPNERNRNVKTRSSNRYIKTIKYGNKIPNRDERSWEAFSAFDIPDGEWMFTVAFDYGEHDIEFPKLDDNAPWLSRKDPFSSYRSGFEIRTYRLCRRILMFHHFIAELPIEDYLVSSTNLVYDETPSVTYLTSVTHVGYLLDGTNNRYMSKSLPPLEFEYSRFPSDEQLSRLEAKEIDPVSLENIPYGVDGQNYQWLDLDGEGLPGVLTEQATGWFYKRNLSANNQFQTLNSTKSEPTTIAKLGPTENVCPKPLSYLTGGRSFFADVSGDGLMGLVRMADRRIWGYHSREFAMAQAKGWTPFRTFDIIVNINPDDPDLRFIDLTGDGLPDILITGDNAFLWHPWLGREGCREGFITPQSLDEEKGPKLVFSDPEQTIYLADMSGDGLTDLLRVRNGQICYWPNTGYGTFGAKVTMDNSPWFAEVGHFNQQYVQIADIDGSGTSDIMYISSSGVDIYLNQAGNGFSDRKRLAIFPPTENISNIAAIDLLGTGTTSLVWSSASCNIQLPMKYIDITNGKKPHLLIKDLNNFGAETRIHYAPSTKFYLDDKQAGRKWITLLPFPVQCVEKVEILDRVSHNRFVNRYAYHHGYFDGYEREYRGFGMVEQWDTEEFAAMSTQSSFEETGINVDSTWHVPPVYTKTWFHTGAFVGDRSLSRSLVYEYFGAPSPTNQGAFEDFLATQVLEDSFIPPGLDYDETRESCRALVGHRLRQEVYGEDDSRKSRVPYTVTESNYTVSVVQKLQDLHRHSIITVHPRETISSNFERNKDDPRKMHTLVLEVNQYGDILKKVDIAYRRKRNESSLTESDPRIEKVQGQSLLVYVENDFTTKIDGADSYLLPTLCESRSYELYGFEPEEGTIKFSLQQFTRDNFAALSIPEIPYESLGDPSQGWHKRLFEQSRIIFRSNDLSRLLPVGKIETMALVGESYNLAFNSGLVGKVFQRRLDDDAIESLIPDPSEMIGRASSSSGGYVDLDLDGSWWIPSGRSYFATESGLDDSPEADWQWRGSTSSAYNVKWTHLATTQSHATTRTISAAFVS